MSERAGKQLEVWAGEPSPTAKDSSRSMGRPPSQTCPSIRASPGCRQAAPLITGFNNSSCWKVACKEQINSGRRLQKAVLPHSFLRANLQRERCRRKACRIQACDYVLAHTHTHTPVKFFYLHLRRRKNNPFSGCLVTLLFGKQGEGSAGAWDKRKLWQFIRAGAPGEQLAFRDQSLPGTEREHPAAKPSTFCCRN